MEKKIIQQALANKQPLPEAIANAPDLFLGLDFYFRAFIDLHTCRQVGMGRGPIPWTAVNEYAAVNDLSGEEREDFLFLVQNLDDKYLAWAQDQDKKQTKRR